MTPAERAARVRRGIGFFPDLARGVVEVKGADRVRWLNGMVTADVSELSPGEGARALLLSAKGRILGDMHVLAREDRFWLDTSREQVETLVAALDRYVIADDVTLVDASETIWRASLEGPDTLACLSALGVEAPARAESTKDVEIGGVRVVLAAFGESGEAAVQIFAPAGDAERVRRAVVGVAGSSLVVGDAAVLDVLRIEAGTPRVGSELDDEVFPAEAGLVEAAVSLTKGCFTGQEIVARIESRGGVHHQLVGLRFEKDLPAVGSALLTSEGKRVGEVTSVCRSTAGLLGLGFVRRSVEEPETRLSLEGGGSARVAALPFVPPAAS